MEAAGLHRILAQCEQFGLPSLDKNIKILRDMLDDDAARLREEMDQKILRDLSNPQDVYNAISAKIENTKAGDHFLSMMQHLLLIREEGPPLVHYFQLIDSLVTDVVLDKKLAGAEQRLGHSVDRIIAQFNEADRYQSLSEEATEARNTASRLQREKDLLEEEISQGQDGLVGRLKEQQKHLEQQLSISRETTNRLQGQLATQKSGYEERIAQLEAQIMELFRMLREVGNNVDTILDQGAMDRRTLVDTLEKQFQRNKTISILEGNKGWGKMGGKSKRGGTGGGGDGQGDGEDGEDGDDIDATPGKSSLRRGSKSIGSRKKSTKGARVTGGATKLDEAGRVSQFMDADEDDAREQIQQQLAAGTQVVRLVFFIGLLLDRH